MWYGQYRRDESMALTHIQARITWKMSKFAIFKAGVFLSKIDFFELHQFFKLFNYSNRFPGPAKMKNVSATVCRVALLQQS